MSITGYPRKITDEEWAHVETWWDALPPEERSTISVSVWTGDYKTLLEVWYKDGREVMV